MAKKTTKKTEKVEKKPAGKKTAETPKKKEPGKITKSIKSYEQQLIEAYRRGYMDGHAAVKDIPQVVGARLASSKGYSDGQKDGKELKRINDKLKNNKGENNHGKSQKERK